MFRNFGHDQQIQESKTGILRDAEDAGIITNTNSATVGNRIFDSDEDENALCA